MARLTGKNILFIIPKDYYDEDILDPLIEAMKKEEAETYIASAKMKEAVGMKTGRQMPNFLIVDAIEGIIGDSYVAGGRGTRQVKGVFHGVILVGGKGARSHLWKDELVRLLIADRHRSNMVIGAVGSAVPCLSNAGLMDDREVAVADDKHTKKALEEMKALMSTDDVTNYERVITGKGPAAVPAFAEAFIAEVAETPLK